LIEVEIISNHLKMVSLPPSQFLSQIFIVAIMIFSEILG